MAKKGENDLAVVDLLCVARCANGSPLKTTAVFYPSPQHGQPSTGSGQTWRTALGSSQNALVTARTTADSLCKVKRHGRVAWLPLHNWPCRWLSFLLPAACRAAARVPGPLARWGWRWQHPRRTLAHTTAVAAAAAAVAAAAAESTLALQPQQAVVKVCGVTDAEDAAAAAAAGGPQAGSSMTVVPRQ